MDAESTERVNGWTREALAKVPCDFEMRFTIELQPSRGNMIDIELIVDLIVITDFDLTIFILFLLFFIVMLSIRYLNSEYFKSEYFRFKYAVWRTKFRILSF